MYCTKFERQLMYGYAQYDMRVRIHTNCNAAIEEIVLLIKCILKRLFSYTDTFTIFLVRVQVIVYEYLLFEKFHELIIC